MTPVGAAGRPAPETTVPADPRLPATHPLIFESSDEGVATMAPPEHPDLPSPAAGPAFVVRDLLLGAGDRGPEKSQAAGPPVRLALGPPVTGLHRFGATDAVADTGSPSQPGRASPETLPALLAHAGPAVTPGPVQLAAAITPSRSPRLSTGVVLAPEPSTGLLVAAGLLAMAGHRRRQ